MITIYHHSRLGPLVYGTYAKWNAPTWAYVIILQATMKLECRSSVGLNPSCKKHMRRYSAIGDLVIHRLAGQ